MKKKFLKGILGMFFLVMILLGSFGIVSGQVNISLFNQCSLDNDCIKVQGNCCLCNNGGAMASINKNLREEYQGNLTEQCSSNPNPIVCLTVYTCNLYQDKIPKCINNQCNLVDSTSQETCSNIGQVSNGRYCDVDGIFKSSKIEGMNCTNDYECVKGSCSDGVCQSKYTHLTNLSSRGSLINQVWAFLQGEECVPGDNSCDGTNSLMCGALGAWENKGQIIGICNYNPQQCSENKCESTIFYECVNSIFVNRGQVNGQCDYTTPNNNGNGGGLCTSYWKWESWSDPINNCGTRIGNDLNRCHVDRTKVETKACPGVAPRCGDGNCDSNEDSNSCNVDCPSTTTDLCGNGTCDPTESSAVCGKDCQAKVPNNKWLFWILFLIIIAAIIIIGFLIYKKYEENKNYTSNPNKPKDKNLVSNVPTIQKPQTIPKNPLQDIRHGIRGKSDKDFRVK